MVIWGGCMVIWACTSKLYGVDATIIIFVFIFFFLYRS